MPIVTIQSPTGQSFQIDAPEGATDDQILRFAKSQGLFDEQPVQQPAGVAADVPTPEGLGFPVTDGGIPQGNVLDQVIAPLSSVAGGLAGTIGGGIAGAGELITGGGLDEAVKTLNTVRDSISQAIATNPDTKEAQRGMQILENSIKDIEGVTNFALGGTAGLSQAALTGDIGAARETAGQIGQEGLALGESTFEKTDSPLLATLAEVTPTVAGLLTGRAALPKAAPKKQSALKQKIADDISSGSTDNQVAKFMVDGAGKLQKDKVAIEAIKQGFDEGVVATIKGATKTDKQKMFDMVRVLKKAKTNAKFAAANRPADIAGKSLTDRVNFVKSVERQAGKELDTVAKSLKGQKVDTTPPVDNFIQALDDIGVKFDGLKPNFKGSDIEGAEGAEAFLNKIFKRMRDTKAPDAHDVHRMKKFIDEQVSFGKVKEGLTGKTERIVKNLRRELDQVLDNNFDDYNRVNTNFAEAKTALDDLQSAVGSKVNLFGENADKASGTVLRRLMSNTQSRVNLMDSIKSLESVAKKHKGGFDDDILTQMLFADELEGLFGTTARTSLQGVTEKTIRQAGRGKAEIAIDAAAKVAEKARGINEENAILSIEKLLRNK